MNHFKMKMLIALLAVLKNTFMALIRLVKILLGGQFDIEMGTFYVFIEE
jgi:hypothetical protein